MDDPTEPDDDGAGVVVAPKAEPKKEQDRPPIPKFHVVLWDSDDHTYEYVIMMLRELFGHTLEKSFKLAETVDQKGKAIVLTTTKEHAELKRDQIHAYGKDKNQFLESLDLGGEAAVLESRDEPGSPGKKKRKKPTLVENRWRAPKRAKAGAADEDQVAAAG